MHSNTTPFQPQVFVGQVFVGWSGEHSKNFASVLCRWFPLFFQPEKISIKMSEDLSKGDGWFEELTAFIAQSRVSIFCLNQKNIKEPWIYFEAGLSYGAGKCTHHIVCPLLIDLEKTHIIPPLSALQLTTFEKEDFFRLILTVNESLENKLPPASLEQAFETHWLGFKKEADATAAGDSRITLAL